MINTRAPDGANNRDPTGPEHHWVARKQVRFLFPMQIFSFYTFSSSHCKIYQIPRLQHLCAPPGQIQMPCLQQSHQGSRQVDGGRFRFDFPLSFSLSFLFGSNAGVSCSWCQLSYHGQGGCNEAKLQDKVLSCRS